MAYHARCPTLLTPSNVWISSLFLHLIVGGLTEGLTSVTIAIGADFTKGEATVSSTFAVAFEDAADQYPAVYTNHSWIMRHENFSGTCNESVPNVIDQLGHLYNQFLARNTQPAVIYAPVILLCCLVVPLKAVLRKAHELGMVDGRYVFLLIYTFRVPNEPFLQRQDLSNEVIRESAKSLIVVRSTEFPFAAFQSQLSRMEERKSRLYNVAMNPENQVVNRLCEQQGPSDCHSGAYLAKQLLNRTFYNSLRPLTITPEGTRTTTVEAQMFDNRTNTFTNIMSLNSIERILREERTVPWLLGTAPVDRLPCWPNNDDCDRERHPLLYSLLVILGFALLGWIFGRFLWLQMVFYGGYFTASWWYIQPSELNFSSKKTTFVRASVLLL